MIEETWKKLESKSLKPNNIRNIKKIDYLDFCNLINNKDIIELSKLAEDLYCGDFLLIKNVIDKEYFNSLKKKLMNYSKTEPSSFHKMLQGCPNFHRIIDEDSAKKYSVKAVRHSFYFFRWNNKDFNLFNKINNIWGCVKYLGGLEFDEYVNNKPKDIIIDRVQVVRYPENTGFIEPHRHDTTNQRLIISLYMSKKGKDFETGGTFFFNDKKKIEVESQIDIGDCGIFYGSLEHTVDSVKLFENQINIDNETSGRWWIGLYSPESDHIKERHTSSPISHTK